MTQPLVAAEAMLQTWLDKENRHEHADEMQLAMTRRGSSFTIWDCRPPWDGKPGDWTRMPCARLTLDREHLTWTMQWPNRNSKWLPYDRLPPTAIFQKVLDELKSDPWACFWG